MPTYRFIINGLRHHDFADRLDELFLFALRRRVMLSIEPDNPGEANAVIAYLGQCCLGYVRSAQRAEACGLIRASGLEAMQGRIVEADPQRRWLTVEVVADEVLPSLPIGRPAHPLTGWHFDGRTLPEEEKEHRLRTLLASLLLTVKACEPWEEDMEEWLVYVDQELWRDISSDCSEKVEQLLRLLTDGTTDQPLYAEKALRLQLAIDRMGSPEVRRRQAEHIRQRAFSPSMDELLCHYGDDALQAVLTLPAELLRLYLTDSEALMGRLWYYRLPREQVRGVLTLLALMVRLCFASSDLMGENADEAREASSSTPSALRIAPQCKTKVLIALNAMYRAGWFVDNQGCQLSNRDEALNEILRRAFGEEKSVAVRNLIWPSRNSFNNGSRNQKVLEELLKAGKEES